MTFRKSCKNKGIIIADILLALALAGFFIVIITGSSLEARELFERTRAKDELLDSYDNSQIKAPSRLFGNDRLESRTTFATTSNSLDFVSISERAVDDLADFAGTPLCSVNHSGKETVGSYAYLHGGSNIKVPRDIQVAITPITLPVSPLLPLTDLEVRNSVAYISTDSSVASVPDLIIVDIHDPDRPAILGNINTGPGIVSIALGRKRIYAVAGSTSAQLHIIRLYSPSDLTLEAKFKLPLPYATATPPLGSAIFYNRGKVYLGTEKWDGDEFNIIDVSNPSKPIKVGGSEIGSKVNDIFEMDGIAYLADSDQSQLRIFNVNDPVNVSSTNSFSPSGWQRQEGKTISIFEGALHFGRTSGGFDIVSDHEAFAWSSTSLPVLTSGGSAAFGSMDIPGGVYGIVADRKYIYLATRNINREFQIFDRALTAATSAAFSLPVAPQTMTCDNDKLYILAHTAPVIYRIEFK